jgi:L-lactate dehydrogenase complex protein LldG
VGEAERERVSARDAILGRIRRSLGTSGPEAGRRAIVISRLDSAPRGPIPARGQLPEEEQVVLFCVMADKVSASISRVARLSQVPGAIAAYLRDHNLPPALRMGADKLLNTLPWDSALHIDITHGPSKGEDAVSLSHAVAGIAESGTLVFTSGPDNPTTLNFLPDDHIALLMAEDVVGDTESVFDLIRARYGKGSMPRTLNMITGPSRSADIEQTLLLGAHGPRRLHIVVVG